MTDNVPADPDAMKGTHRLVIPNWSKISEDHLYTSNFVVGGLAWQIEVYPRGNRDAPEHVSVYVHAAGKDTSNAGLERLASYSLTVEGAAKSDDEDEATIKARSVRRGSISRPEDTFNAKRRGIGNADFISIADMDDLNKGLVSRDDTVVITAEVMVRKVIIGVTCARAAADGNLEALKWLRASGAAWDTKTCSAAAAGGHLEILKWSREHGCPWDAATCKSAADGGHLEVLKWARDNGCQWGSWACPWKPGPEHLDVLIEEQERTPEAIPGIPLKVVISHVLRSENLTLRDLAQLRVVSPAMRDAVTATRRKVRKPTPAVV